MFCLREPTDAAWAEKAAMDLDAVLVDHAHCEMKAATNALSLAIRYANDLDLVKALTDIAQEELSHFRRVVELLATRGLALGAPPVDDYAAQLRRAMKALPLNDLPFVIDRLLVGALIEARSCERFKLLLPVLTPDRCSTEMRAFYEELFACEARHYREYIDLAKTAAGERAAEVEPRLDRLADAEASIVRGLASREQRGAVHG